MTAQVHPESQRGKFALRRQLAQQGYQETINFSFVEERWERELAGNADPIRVLNPIASPLAVMRSSLMGGLVAALDFVERLAVGRVDDGKGPAGGGAHRSVADVVELHAPHSARIGMPPLAAWEGLGCRADGRVAVLVRLEPLHRGTAFLLGGMEVAPQVLARRLAAAGARSADVAHAVGELAAQDRAADIAEREDGVGEPRAAE